MKQLLNLLFISIFFFVNLVCSSDDKGHSIPKMKVRCRPPKRSYSMPLSENIAESMENHKPSMTLVPTKIEKIFNRTPYVLAVEEVKTFSLLGIINPSSTFYCDYSVDKKH